MFVIRQTRHFFHNSDQRSLVFGDRSNGAMTFDSRADARKWIADAAASEYALAHDEYSRPDYKVLDADDLPAYLAEQI